LTSLRRLDLAGCSKISDEGLSALSCLKIQAIDLSGCMHVGGAGLRHLAGLKSTLGEGNK
jgi:hypothetical protein